MKDGEFHSKVLLILVDYQDGKTRFSKPEDLYAGDYWVDQGDDGEAVVFVNRLKEGANFPVFLQFVANLPITAVGFAESGCVPKCTVKGCCGGCFSLVTDFDEKLRSLKSTPQIRNDGDNPPGGYRFKLWLQCGDSERVIEIDPQIYNQGDTDPPFRRFLRRLCAAWKGMKG